MTEQTTKATTTALVGLIGHYLRSSGKEAKYNITNGLGHLFSKTRISCKDKHNIATNVFKRCRKKAIF